MSKVIVTHASGDEARATLVAQKLLALGYAVRFNAAEARTVSPMARRALEQDIAAADCVLVLWSREAGSYPGVLSLAARAKAAGKLTLARLDAAAPPARFGAGANLNGWLGREDARGWRALSAAIAASSPGKRGPAATPLDRKSLAQPRSAASAQPEEPAKKRSGATGLIVALVVAFAAAAGAGYYFLMG